MSFFYQKSPKFILFVIIFRNSVLKEIHVSCKYPSVTVVQDFSYDSNILTSHHNSKSKLHP